MIDRYLEASSALVIVGRASPQSLESDANIAKRVFTGELFPVVGEYLERHTPLVHGSDKCLATALPEGA